MFRDYLHRVYQTLIRGRKRRAPKITRTCRPAAARLAVEGLEDRFLLSTVTNLDDAGPGSLRQAILDTPAGGAVDFQKGLTGTITLGTGELALTKDLTIAGPGADVITVSGNQASRVFIIGAQSTVMISGLTIADGKVTGAGARGGGILNAGTLTVTASTIHGNASNVEEEDGGGGGISNAGTLTVIGSTLNDNSSDGGGGIYNDDGTVTIDRSIVSDNIGFEGGGIRNLFGRVTVTDSSFSRNLADTGEGIYSIGGTAVITGSLFSDNSGGTFEGGAIYNGGMMTVTGCTFSRNSQRFGAGIFNTGTLTVTATTFDGNRGQGGGIFNLQGTVAVTDSTFNGNRGVGGGIATDSNPVSHSETMVTNCTFSGNSGGAIRVPNSTVRITSSTLSGNDVGLVQVGPGALITARNTIVAGNATDVSGTLTSQGHNLIGDGTGGAGFTDTDLVGTADAPIDPLLGPLQDNGGPTQTMALLPGSPARGAGDPTDAPEWDQRGPGFPRVVDGAMDIGAYQVQEGEGTAPHGQPQGRALSASVAVLIGNGSNVLTGGDGRLNLLIAGGSASTLLGGNDDDILIGGTTAYDTEAGLVSLQAIMNYWSSTTDDYATRVANLLSSNGVPLLEATMVTNNGGGNTMMGNHGGAGEMNLFYGLDPTLETTDYNPGIGEEFINC
jgi:hypothetical protein